MSDIKAPGMCPWCGRRPSKCKCERVKPAPGQRVLPKVTPPTPTEETAHVNAMTAEEASGILRGLEDIAAGRTKPLADVREETAQGKDALIQRAVQVLGPQAADCGCAGCSTEVNEALRLLAEAGYHYQPRKREETAQEGRESVLDADGNVSWKKLWATPPAAAGEREPITPCRWSKEEDFVRAAAEGERPDEKDADRWFNEGARAYEAVGLTMLDCPYDHETQDRAHHWWTRGFGYVARQMRAIEAELKLKKEAKAAPGLEARLDEIAREAAARIHWLDLQGGFEWPADAESAIRRALDTAREEGK